MKLRANKTGKGYITSYTLCVGSKEARELGFVDEQGVPKELKKTVEAGTGRLIFTVSEETEAK